MNPYAMNVIRYGYTHAHAHAGTHTHAHTHNLGVIVGRSKKVLHDERK